MVLKISIYIHTNINLSLNLESIFKIINSTYIPFIKYNPRKNENIYRLYVIKYLIMILKYLIYLKNQLLNIPN